MPWPFGPQGASMAQIQISTNNPAAAAKASRVQMNDTQAASFDAINCAIQEGNGGCFFVCAPGGCGKSFVAEALLNATLGRGDIAIAYDSSGCCFRAARRRTDSATAQLLRETKLIIWDGAIKAHRGQIEAVDSSLRETMKKQVRRLKTRPPP